MNSICRFIPVSGALTVCLLQLLSLPHVIQRAIAAKGMFLLFLGLYSLSCLVVLVLGGWLLWETTRNKLGRRLEESIRLNQNSITAWYAIFGIAWLLLACWYNYVPSMKNRHVVLFAVFGFILYVIFSWYDATKLERINLAIRLGLISLLLSLFYIPLFLFLFGTDSLYAFSHNKTYGFIDLVSLIFVVLVVLGINFYFFKTSGWTSEYEGEPVDISTRRMRPALLLFLLPAIIWTGISLTQAYKWLPALGFFISIPLIFSSAILAISGSDQNDLVINEGRADQILNLIDHVTALFAVWTIAVNSAYWFYESLAFASIVFIVLAILAVVVLRRLKSPILDTGVSLLEICSPLPVLIAVLLWIMAILFNAPLAIWIGGLVISATFLVKRLVGRSDQIVDLLDREGLPFRGDSLVIVLCIIGVIFSMVTHRADPDDSAYLNLSAVVADHPFEPISHRSPMYSTIEVPYTYSSFPLLSLYHLIGGLSFTTGLQPLSVSAFIITPIASVMLILAYARLCKTIAPAQWIWMLIPLIAVFFIEGSTHQFFTNFGFIRIWQGKSILFHIFIPLTYVYAIRFAEKGYLRDWMLLAATQISMIGLSSIGIWIGPITVGIGLLTGWSFKWSQMARLFLGQIASFYPLIIGIWTFNTAQSALAPIMPSFVWKEQFTLVFGSFASPAIWVWFAALLIALLSNHVHHRSRYLAWYSVFIVFAVFLNPLLKDLVAKNVTSAQIYWRVFWLLPFPIFAAVAMSSLGLAIRVNGTNRLLILLNSIVVYALLVPTIPLASKFNRVTIDMPSVKAVKTDYEVALYLTETLPSDSIVLAPADVSWLLPTLRGSVQPIAPRYNSIQVFRYLLGREDEYEMRRDLMIYADGESPFRKSIFNRAFEKWDIQAVLVVSDVMDIDKLSDFLQNAGFEMEDLGIYILWIRDDQ